MSDINSSYNNYGYRIERAGTARIRGDKKMQHAEVPAETENQKVIQDTGILGRSQIYGIKGGNIKKSAEEAAAMAKFQPVRLRCSEKMYETLYNEFLKEGLDEETAAKYALIGEEEFLNISSALRR